MVRRKAIGFTYIEVMIIIVLISFVCVVTTKVIQHNLEQKIPLYVYNLYKNLDTESKLLTKRFLTEDENGLNGSSSSSSSSLGTGSFGEEAGIAGSGTSSGSSSSASSSGIGNKTIEEILKKVDAKTYCKAFAKDINLAGEVDCENSVEDEEAGFSGNRSIQYDCSRSYSFRVNDDGSYLETLNPIYNSNLSQCLNNENFSDKTISCNAKPTIAVNDLLKKNTEENFTYSCKKSEETNEDGADETKTEKSQFSLDSKPKTGKALRTTNNVYLKFVTLKPSDGKYTLKYNLLANIGQDEICPKISRASFDTSESLTCNVNNITVLNLHKSGNSYNDLTHYQREKYKFYCFKLTDFYYKNEIILSNGKVGEASQSEHIGILFSIPELAQNCNGYIEHAKKMYKLKQINYQNYVSGSAWPENDTITINSSICSDTNDTERKELCALTPSNVPGDVGLIYGVTSLSKNSPFDTDTQNFNHELYYTKWNSFFTNNNFAKVTKDAINLQEVNEGSLEKTIENTSSGTTNLNEYIAHFIYAAIDIPFSKGKMNKNIFVFEQFGNNIIPVGYLANNPNTPLKFDVVTRGTNTLNITKLNKKPLTFCEAMQYTGDKFSKYCSCKNLSGSVVTQYPKSSVCDNNFGCRIKPVQPSNVAPKFKLF